MFLFWERSRTEPTYYSSTSVTADFHGSLDASGHILEGKQPWNSCPQWGTSPVNSRLWGELHPCLLPVVSLSHVKEKIENISLPNFSLATCLLFWFWNSACRLIKLSPTGKTLHNKNLYSAPCIFSIYVSLHYNWKQWGLSCSPDRLGFISQWNANVGHSEILISYLQCVGRDWHVWAVGGPVFPLQLLAGKH